MIQSAQLFGHYLSLSLNVCEGMRSPHSNWPALYAFRSPVRSYLAALAISSASASSIALTIHSTFSRTMASSLLSNVARSNCMISAGLAPCLFPIAVFHCLATENRTRHAGHAFSASERESENAQESGRYRFMIWTE